MNMGVSTTPWLSVRRPRRAWPSVLSNSNWSMGAIVAEHGVSNAATDVPPARGASTRHTPRNRLRRAASVVPPQGGSRVSGAGGSLQTQDPGHQLGGIDLGNHHLVGRHGQAADLALPVALVGAGAGHHGGGQLLLRAFLALVFGGDLAPGRADRGQAVRAFAAGFDVVAGHAARVGGEFQDLFVTWSGPGLGSEQGGGQCDQEAVHGAFLRGFAGNVFRLAVGPGAGLIFVNARGVRLNPKQSRRPGATGAVSARPGPVPPPARCGCGLPPPTGGPARPPWRRPGCPAGAGPARPTSPRRGLRAGPAAGRRRPAPRPRCAGPGRGSRARPPAADRSRASPPARRPPGAPAATAAAPRARARPGAAGGAWGRRRAPGLRSRARPPCEPARRARRTG